LPRQAVIFNTAVYWSGCRLHDVRSGIWFLIVQKFFSWHRDSPWIPFDLHCCLWCVDKSSLPLHKPPLSTASVKERVELYLSFCGPIA